MSEPTASGAQQDITQAAALLTRLTGLRITGDRSPRATERIVHAMRQAGVSGRAYHDLLEQDPEAFQELVHHVTVGETHFFREPAHLELLRDRILPGLVRDRAPDHRLQLWSAGCASGEEAYTLAILLEEQGLADRAEVLATDISAAALHRARSARYRPWSLRGVDDRRREAYFQEQDGYLQLHPRVAERVRFQLHNLVADAYPAPPGGFDVIFCRNVLIYLIPEATAAVVGRLAGTLAPGGWLLTASTDPHLSSVPGLRVVATEGAVAYQRPTRDATPVERGSGPPVAARPAAPVRPTRDTAPRPPEDQPAAAPDPRPAIDPEAERQYRHAAALLEEHRWQDAARAARRALYLEPELVVAQIALGRACLHTGDLAGAARAWRNARTLLERTSAETPVALAGGASAGRLLAELAALGAAPADQP